MLQGSCPSRTAPDYYFWNALNPGTCVICRNSCAALTHNVSEMAGRGHGVFCDSLKIR